MVKSLNAGTSTIFGSAASALSQFNFTFHTRPHQAVFREIGAQRFNRFGIAPCRSGDKAAKVSIIFASCGGQREKAQCRRLYLKRAADAWGRRDFWAAERESRAGENP